MDTSALHSSIEPFQIVKCVTSSTHSALITASGKLYTRGQNICGQLGHGNLRSVADFKLVDYFCQRKDFITDVAVTTDHTVVLTSMGQVYAFGENKNLHLGVPSLGSTTTTPTPFQLSFKKIGSISSALSNTPPSASSFGTLLNLNSNNDISSSSTIIKGITCSLNNTVAYTGNYLHFFGTNIGQFGTNSLSSTFSLFWKYDDPVYKVLALESATIVLTENTSQIHIYMNSFHVRLANVPGTAGVTEWNRFRPVVISKPKKVIKLIPSFKPSNTHYSVLLLYEHGEVQQMTFSKTNDSKEQLISDIKYYQIWRPKNIEMRALDVVLNDTGVIFICTKGGEVLKKSPTTKAKNKWNRMKGFEGVTSISGFKGETIVAVRNEIQALKHQLLQPTVLLDVGKLSPLCGIEEDENGELDPINNEAKDFDFLSSHLIHLNDSDDDDDDEDVEDEPSRKSLKAKIYRSNNIRKNVLSGDFLYKLSSLHSSIINFNQVDSSLDVELKFYDYNVIINDTKNNLDLIIPAHLQLVLNRLDIRKSDLPLHIERRDLVIFVTKDVMSIVGDIDIKSVAIYLHYIYTNEQVDCWNLQADGLGNPASQARRIKTGWDKLLFALPVKESLQYALNKYIDDGDVIIQLEDAQIKSWKYILTSRCEYLRLMMGNYWKANELLEFPYISLQIWNLLTKYLIGFKHDEIFKEVLYECKDDVNEFINVVLRLAEVSDQFLLPGLKRYCELALKDYICLENYVILSKHSWVLGFNQLFSNCCWFIFCNMKLCLFDNDLNLKDLGCDCVKLMESRFKEIVSTYFKNWKKEAKILPKKSKKYKFGPPIFEEDLVNMKNFDLTLFIENEDKFNGYYLHPILWKVIPKFYEESELKKHEFMIKRKASTVKIQISDIAKQQHKDIQTQKILSATVDLDGLNNSSAIDDTDADDDFIFVEKGRRKSSRSVSMSAAVSTSASTSSVTPAPISAPNVLDAVNTTWRSNSNTSLNEASMSKSSSVTSNFSNAPSLDEAFKQNNALNKKKPVFKSSVFKVSKKERLEEQRKLDEQEAEKAKIKLAPWGMNAPKVISSTNTIEIAERGTATVLSQNKLTNVHFPSLGELNRPKKSTGINSIGMQATNPNNVIGSFNVPSQPARSLDEIKAEAEFERWWEEESKRVQQREEQQRQRENRERNNTRGNRGRGRGRGRGGKK